MINFVYFFILYSTNMHYPRFICCRITLTYAFMPKLIDYPRTSYTGAWEIAEVVDDTGGKCALETCARKLNRKVSGSFKAIIGSAVKFGLLTSKRELLTTTTLFRRIKHAYDKQEELVFHREAFLTPPLFTQLCRKFRSRELPVAMLDVLLIREFDVEEINAQGVAKAFIDGARMVGILNEDNNVADIDQLNAKQPPRRELANPSPIPNSFRQASAPIAADTEAVFPDPTETPASEISTNLVSADLNAKAVTTGREIPPKTAPPTTTRGGLPLPASRPAPAVTTDAIANLFGLSNASSISDNQTATTTLPTPAVARVPYVEAESATPATSVPPAASGLASAAAGKPLFQLQLIGPGINTSLEVIDADDLSLVRALLDKIERQLKRGQ